MISCLFIMTPDENECRRIVHLRWQRGDALLSRANTYIALLQIKWLRQFNVKNANGMVALVRASRG